MSIYKSVLLVDDDLITNLLNEKIILKNEIADTVYKFTDARSALHLLRSMAVSFKGNNLPELIFVDINMPEISGWEFIEALLTIREIDMNRCRVIMLSSSIDIMDIQRSVRYPIISNFISKPLTPDKLNSITKNEIKFYPFEEFNFNAPLKGIKKPNAS